MKVKVILVNFQNEYLSKKGKWYRKSKITNFIIDRFIPFCERHNLSVYEIKSDYSSPNSTKQVGCAPGTYGFKTLISDSKFASSPFIKSDNSPNFVREKNGEMPVEKPIEFKHWLDVNIGDPSQIGYVLILGMGLEASITMIGHQMSKYGYKIKILKEGTESTNKNKKYTDFMLDKFPLVSWGKVVTFVNFVKDLKKYSKITPVESGWKPSPYPPLEGDEEPVPELDTSFATIEKKEPLKENEKRPINLMTTDEGATLSKAETIAMMKNQMKNQYKTDNEIEDDEKAFEEEPAKPINKAEQKLNQTDAARKRVEDYYRRMYGEEETVKEVEQPVQQVVQQPIQQPVQQPVQQVAPTPVVTKVVEPVITQPVVQQIHIKNTKPAPSKEKYAYIFDTMIYIENQLYKDRQKEVTPANFVKSNIINGNVGTRKNIKPKTTNINKISVHERYMLQAQKQKRDNAINGVKTKLSDGKKDE